MPRKGDSILQARLPPTHLIALQLQARKASITLSEYVREMVRQHLETVYYNKKPSVVHLKNLTRIAKQYIVTVELSRQWPSKVPMKGEKEAGLPGAPKRDALERLVWQAIQEAVAYSKTEDAAREAEARLLALRVANLLMRTELAILKHQDDAFVDELIKELRGDTDELEKETRKGA